MKMTFRWYGEEDSISLSAIRQIPNMSGVVTAVYRVPVGEVWPREDIARLHKLSQENGLAMEVIESVPVHEDIKLGRPTRDRLIANYAENIRRLGEVGVRCVCYNFMPVFDWLRTDLHTIAADGSASLSYHHASLMEMDPHHLSLPGWDESYTQEGLRALLAEYKSVDEEKLWENMSYFLHGIIPVCEENGIKMAIHPDDPPWGIFGLPRVITNAKNLERFVKLVDSECNGLTLCTGSLGVDPKNDVVDMIRHFGSMRRIHFLHARNIKIVGARDFNETGHYSPNGSLDMYDILRAAWDVDFDGYIRPDHGRMIWGESGRPGYGLYDRALGATYINGIWEAINKSVK